MLNISPFIFYHSVTLDRVSTPLQNRLILTTRPNIIWLQKVSNTPFTFPGFVNFQSQNDFLSVCESAPFTDWPCPINSFYAFQPNSWSVLHPRIWEKVKWKNKRWWQRCGVEVWKFCQRLHLSSNCWDGSSEAGSPWSSFRFSLFHTFTQAGLSLKVRPSMLQIMILWFKIQ